MVGVQNRMFVRPLSSHFPHPCGCLLFFLGLQLSDLSQYTSLLLLVRGLVSTHLKFMSLVFSLSSLISRGVQLKGCTVVRWLTLSPHYEKAQVQNLARTWEPAPSPRRCLGFLLLPPSVQRVLPRFIEQPIQGVPYL